MAGRRPSEALKVMKTQNLGASPVSEKMPIVQWAKSYTEYLELCDGEPGSITLLDPHDPVRRERWTQAISWYASCPGWNSSRSQSNSLVISLDRGSGTNVIGRILAKRLGWTHRDLKVIEELPGEALSDCAAILVAPRGELDLAMLGRVYRRFESAGATFGVLTAADLPGLSFIAAKCCLTPSILPSGDFVLDAVFGERESLGDVINRPAGWRLALLMAHGEGAHLHLGNGVLCGLLGTHELIDGIRVPEGCGVQDCKRARKAHLATIPANRLRCRILALLSCNSFSVAKELYPSDTSLVLAAADGWPAAVIANPTSMGFSPTQAIFLQRLLSRGALLGEAVATLNRTVRMSPDYPPYVLLGDPLCRVMPTIDAGDNEGSTAVHVLPRVDGATYDLAPWIKDGSLVGHSEVFILNDSSMTSTPKVSDKTFELNRLQTRLEVIGLRLINVNHWLSILLSLSSGDAFDEALADLRILTVRIQYAAAALGQAVSKVHELSVWNHSVYQLENNLRDAVSAWDASFALIIHEHLLSGGGPVGDSLIELLIGTHVFERQVQGSRCRRCHTTTTNNIYRCLVTGAKSRLEDCTLCGPLSATPGVSVKLDMEADGRVGLDKDFSARVNLTGSKEPGFLVVEFRDKSHPGAKLRTIDEWLAGQTSRVLSLSLAGSGCDQHSIRAVWIGGLEWVYARRVISVVPHLSE
jgi:hypothetical protein